MKFLASIITILVATHVVVATAIQTRSGEDNEVVITVTHDDYPLETGWTLADDSNGAVVASQVEESFGRVGGTSVETVYLAEGSYTFEMTDSYGDGICCQHGAGEFEITVNGNGNTVATGGQFTDVDTKAFVVGGTSTPGSGDSGSGSDSVVEYRVDVTYDDYPWETRWLLKQVSTGTILVDYNFDEVNTEGFSLSVSVDLIPGEQYRLVVRDSFGDGFCCDYGEGSIAVYATVNGVTEVLASSDGSFGARENKSFTVPDYSSSSSSSSSSLHVALIGDSDIDYWPEYLLPSIEGATVSIEGYPGDTLDQVVKYVEASLLENEADLLVLVVCAGENDIGDGIPLVESEHAFERLLEIAFDRPNPETIRLIFLGPKFEPWLQDDPDAREQYISMSSVFEQYRGVHPMSQFISFVNCLTMFCGESGEQPGAVLGGKAIAEQKYFQSDQVHLSRDGYEIWKEVVEGNILQLVS
jgi:lysophospholipase L1-like esterase